MKLPALVTQTSNWLGIDRSTVDACARSLRAFERLTSGGVGGGAKDMTQDDALTLLFAVCGCSTASKAGANIEGWRQSRRFDGSDAYADSGFAFMRELTFIEALRTLLVSDLSANGAVSRFAAESDAHALEMRYPAQLHELTVSFDVDGYSGSIELQRVLIDTGAREVGRQRSFARYGLMLDVTRSDNFIRVRDHGFAADSKLVRQLGEKNLRGWRRYALELVD